MAFRKVASFTELWDGEMQACLADGRKVLLVRQGAAVHAYEDRCAHLGVALSEGGLHDGVITCGAHHYQYDAGTGRGINPTTVRLTAFAVKLEGDAVLVDVERIIDPIER